MELLNMSDSALVVALDYDELAPALALVDRLGNAVRWYKIGKQLFTRTGPAALAALKSRGCQVFLDLKFHDIPNTVGQAVSAALDLGADMVNVHASGGRAMLEAAAKAGARSNPRAMVIAVTVLTSLDGAALAEVGLPPDPAAQALRLAGLAHAAGLHGVVCSAHEIVSIRGLTGPDFRLVVPGLRPAGSAADDQKRVMTPRAAALAGADYLVIGRPITAAPDPVAAALALAADLPS
jgi:orotidine-5'-phosphate decarboxylase